MGEKFEERRIKIKQTKRGENYFYASKNLIFHSIKEAAEDEKINE
jgi:hypothetical protein